MKIELRKQVLLAPLTFYGVGGPADELYEIYDTEGFGELWGETIAEKIPSIILGKGSNLLLSDKGFRGRVFVLKDETTTWHDERTVTVASGRLWQSFVEETNEKGWGDLCNLSGIPGVVGGFIRGNAGAFGAETKDTLIAIEYLDESGQIQKISSEKAEFHYRESIFKSHPEWCILRGTFQFKKQESPQTALQKTKNILADRWAKYPPGRSGGSFFKNPTPGEVFAGKLLENAGAKGDTIGHAQISERHANFILNLEGKATQRDILMLARKWQHRVFENTGIPLEPEIFIADEYGKKIAL